MIMGSSCCNSCDEAPGLVMEDGEEQAYHVCADRLSLDAQNGIITALEHYPVGRANAVQVAVYVFAGSGLLNGTAFLQATNDLHNHVTIGSVALNGLGIYTFQVTNIAFSDLRVIFVVNSGGSSRYIVAVDLSLAGFFHNPLS